MKILELKNSISFKLLKMILLAYFSITILTLSVQAYFSYNSTLKKVNNEIILIEDKFKDSLSAAVWNFSVEEIDSILKGINNNHYISGVKLLDKNNILLNEKGIIDKSNFKYSFFLNRNYKDQEHIIGKIKIYSSEDILFEEFQENIYFIIKNNLFILFVLSIILFLIFYKYLTKPLNELTLVLEGLNLENLKDCKLLKDNININNENKDELELFKNSFIKMSSKILLSAKELHNLNVTLEKKVNDRTKKLQEANEKLEKLSNFDSLTNLHNRRYLDYHLELTWRAHKRDKKEISLMMIDIDWFKNYNDTYGHQMGDNCLSSISKVFRNSLKRATDIAARYGGEEFCIVISAENNKAFEIGEKIRKKVEELNIEHKSSPKGIVTISIGINTIIPSEDSNISSLINNADKALYFSKGNGRNQVNIFH